MILHSDTDLKVSCIHSIHPRASWGKIEEASHALNYQGNIFQVSGSIKPNRMNILLAMSREIRQPYISIYVNPINR